MGLLANIFTWWNGATIGTALYSWRKGVHVGDDMLGNRYYQTRDGKRRWVIYQGANDASRVPPEWHGWLHFTLDDVPDRALPPPPPWIDAPTANLTGSPAAYRPAGALERKGRHAPATGDYSAWTP